jgi:hypothetical protein
MSCKDCKDKEKKFMDDKLIRDVIPSKLITEYFNNTDNLKDVDNIIHSCDISNRGLYLGDIWASKEEYDDLVDHTNTTFQYYAELLSKSDFDLSWLLDEDNIDNRIIDARDKMFNNVYYVLDAIENNELKDTLKDFVDTRVEQIENDFDTISILGDWNDLE